MPYRVTREEAGSSGSCVIWRGVCVPRDLSDNSEWKGGSSIRLEAGMTVGGGLLVLHHDHNVGDIDVEIVTIFIRR